MENNTNFQTFHQMGAAINDFVKQATGRDNVQNIDIDHITVAQNHYYEYVDVSGSGVSFHAGAAGLPLEKCVVQIEPVQKGSGDPSPDNVRPITGWTGAKVTRTGKNLLDATLFANVSDTLQYVEVSLNPNTTYTFSTSCPQRDGSIADLFFMLPSEAASSQTNGSYAGRSVTLTTGADGNVKIGYRLGYHPKKEWHAYTKQLEQGSTATAYEPYQGETYDITFPSEAGTVYGGTLDVTTGELVVDRGYRAVLTSDTTRLFGKLNDNTYRVGIVTSGMKAPTWNVTAEEIDMLCNIAVPDASAVHSAANAEPWQCCLYKDGNHNLAVFTVQAEYDAAQKALAALVDMECVYCYPLANPITYTFTPQEVTTLLGLNHVWADTGDIEVKFTDLKELY